ncbi:PepSY-like domain-containing protein [uncultured Arcticibacterium sp.]|uniref:PepSY-like domain-containing protein n=1 Tax=uncultured Arcticibacterium sp. TaxID=2173042 RepID=UPI0030FABC3F
MNRIIGILVLTLLAKATFGQSISQSKVPAVVLNAFQLKYPNAEDIRWKKDKVKYEINYKVNSKSHKLKMDYKGSVSEHSQDLYLSEIPKEVLGIIREKAPFFDLQDADLYEKNGSITYVTKVRIDGSNSYFWINEKAELQKYRRELKDSEIPAPIMKMIKSEYSTLDIKRAKYVEDKENINYIIGGDINGKDNVFWFDIKSNFLGHKQDLRDAEIPAAILKTVSSAYEGYDIKDADMIRTPKSQTWVLRLKKSNENMKVTFDKSGKILEVN